MQGFRDAGLNPILAAGRFSGATSPGTGTPGPVGQSSGTNFSSSYRDAASAKLAKAQMRTQDEMTRYYSSMADKEHWESISSSVKAYKDKLLSKAYDNPVVQKTAPYMRAYSESGLPASSAMQLFNNFTRFYKGGK